MTKQVKLVVMISGSGSNLQALINAIEAGRLPAKIIHVISNRPDAYGLRRAVQNDIPTSVLPHTQNRADYDTRLGRFVADLSPNWVILAGWMRILSMNFLHHVPGKVINLHPALPGQFAGTHAIERAFEAFQRGEIDHTGIMVHLVPDEGVDDGPVLATQIVPILPNDTVDTLEERIHAAEHKLLVETVYNLIVQGE